MLKEKKNPNKLKDSHLPTPSSDFSTIVYTPSNLYFIWYKYRWELSETWGGYNLHCSPYTHF